MTIFGYACVSLLFILIQTSLIPQLFLSTPFDLLLVQVVYTALNLAALPGTVVVLFTGLLADGLSGTPFGLYTTSYLWLFIVLQVGVQVLHVHSRGLLYVAILAGIVLENLVALFCLSVGGGENAMGLGLFHAGRQLLWAAVLGPILYGCLRVIYSMGAESGRVAAARMKGGRSVS